MRLQPSLDVDMPDLAAELERLAPDAINALPFGVIRLDAHFRVVFYSDVERQQSGFRKEAEGRPFFEQIAPCLNTPAFRARIDAALADGTLDITFDQIADLPGGPRDADLHMRILAADGGGCWILTELAG